MNEFLFKKSISTVHSDINHFTSYKPQPINVLSPSVINFSNYIFSLSLQNLLLKGPKHTLNTPINPLLEYVNHKTFARRLNLIEFFQDEPNNNNNNNYYVPGASNFDPIPYNNPLLQIFNKTNTPITNNFSSTSASIDLKALLKTTHFLKFCKADKSNTIIILHIKDYDKLIQTHLQDISTYQQIDNFKEINLINTLKQHYQANYQHIDQSTFKFLNYFKDTQLCSFHILPKIHKCQHILNNLSNNTQTFLTSSLPTDLTSRPIVANKHYFTSRLSIFLNDILKPFLAMVPSHLKDTFSFLKWLPANVPTTTSYLHTADVSSLYTNINNTFGIRAIDYFFTTYPHISKFPKSFIISSLILLLDNNFFTYKRIIFRQIRGVAMGTNMAPTYANLVMGYLECQVFLHPSLNNLTRSHLSLFYKRYIDDIFVVWNPDLPCFKQFLSLFNIISSDINIIPSAPSNVISFLDTTIVILTNSCICSDIYYKPTNNFNYISFNSLFPKHIKTNVAYNLFSRINNIVSFTPWKIFRFCQLFFILRALHYPSLLLLDCITRALSPATHFSHSSTKQIVPYITSDPSYFHKFVKPFLHNLSLFNSNYDQYIFPVVQTKPLNIINFLKTSIKIKKVHPCNRARCLTCPIFLIFSSSITLNNITINFNRTMSCISSFVIYVLFCKCNSFYIGKSEKPFHIRLNSHRHQLVHDINDQTIPFIRHVKSCSNSLSCSLIHQSPKIPLTLELTEQYFIKLLKPPFNF